MSRPRDTAPGRLWNVLVPMALILTGVGWLALGFAWGASLVARGMTVNLRGGGSIGCGPRAPNVAFWRSRDSIRLWIPHPTNGGSYRRVDARSWRAAQREAAKHGAGLVSIGRAAEQEWLVNTFGGDENFWIGLTDADTEGGWRWVDGPRATYTNWADAEPNNMYDQGEHPAVMNWRAPGKWNDMSASSGRASNVRAAILERPSRPTANASPRGRGPDVQGSSVIPVVR